MRLIVGLLACLTVGGISDALADPPAAATAPAVSASDSATAAAAAAAEANRMRAAGYKLEMQNGNKVWCRTESNTGTRLASKKTCLTPEQLAQSAQETQDRLRDGLNKQLNPSGH